jgi:hypothetical protein
MAKHVVICGLAPEVVDYPRHPGLTEEKLRADLNADAANLQALGYTVEFSVISDFAAGALSLLRSRIVLAVVFLLEPACAPHQSTSCYSNS